MTNKFLSAIVASAGCLLLIAGVSSTSDAGQFYQGKTIDIIVGFSAGGGYDQAARLLSRHLGDHIPGHPNVMVENRAGAGGLIAADYVALQAKPDGLTIAESNGGSYALRKVLGDQSIGFNAGKLGWIGTLSPATPVCAIMGFTGFKSFKDILKSKKPIPMGATHAGSAPAAVPEILNWALGTKFKVIMGFGGTSKIRLAMQGHELSGACWTWESMRTTGRAMLKAKGGDKLIPFVIARRWNDPEVKNIPLISDVIKDPEKLAGYNSWAAIYTMDHPFNVAAGVPKERLKTLQQAFEATTKDPKFLADAKKSNLIIDYVSPEDIHHAMNYIYGLRPKMVKELQFLLPVKKKKH